MYFDHVALYTVTIPSLWQHNKPLYSFEDNADYVYDVMWSPVHPALFATVDGNGRLDLWNLNNYTEVKGSAAHYILYSVICLLYYIRRAFISYFN